MSKHDTILMTGMPGSGTSRLGESLAEYLNSPLRSVEHVSLGDRVRAIGKGAIESLYGSHIARHLESPHPEDLIRDEIITGVVEEILDEHRDTNLLLLDGYPRTIFQAYDAFRANYRYDRILRGAIITQTDELTATTRMLGREKRPMTLDEAHSRLEGYRLNAPETIETLGKRGILLARIDTSGEKADTDEAGIRALTAMLDPSFAEVAS